MTSERLRNWVMNGKAGDEVAQEIYPENYQEIGEISYSDQKDIERVNSIRNVVDTYDAIFRAKKEYTNALVRARELGISAESLGNSIGITGAAVRTWLRRNS